MNRWIVQSRHVHSSVNAKGRKLIALKALIVNPRPSLKSNEDIEILFLSIRMKNGIDVPLRCLH